MPCTPPLRDHWFSIRDTHEHILARESCEGSTSRFPIACRLDTDPSKGTRRLIRRPKRRRPLPVVGVRWRTCNAEWGTNWFIGPPPAQEFTGTPWKKQHLLIDVSLYQSERCGPKLPFLMRPGHAIVYKDFQQFAAREIGPRFSR